MYDVIIIGAGPAGMMASISASEGNHKVLLIEKNAKVGKKLQLTGGTRCNLTNLKDNNSFIKELPINGKFLYSSLMQFSPYDIYNYFNDSGVPLKTEDNDRVFPTSNKSQTIIDFLYQKMISNNVIIHLNETVKSLINYSEFDKEIITNLGTYKTKKVIIATGGMSYPETGSTGDGYIFCEDIKQPLTPIYPAETFLICKNIHPLSGVTINNVSITLDKEKSTGSLLFTHLGISGPAVLKISEKVYHKLKDNSVVTLLIDFIPDYKASEMINNLKNNEPKKDLNSFLKEYLPKSLINYIISEDDLKEKIGSISNEKKQMVINSLKSFPMEIKSTGSIEQSFVTGGGVDLKYINSKTMESTKNKGVYFAGELLDIHGHTGGYNITIALSTGFTAGRDIS